MLRSVDPSIWVLLIGIAVRIDTALRFDPANGYDGPDHMRYTDILGGGTIPRVGVETWESQHPLLFYSLAIVLEKLGLGRHGGTIVSLAAGIVRLFVADRIFRWLERGGPGPHAPDDAPPLGPNVRLIANTIHAFVPVGIRMDVFYSPESLAATLALSSVAVALSGRAVLSGIVLGCALLSKASAVSAIPAVAYALSLGLDRRVTWAGVIRVAKAMAIGFVLLMSWGWENVRLFGTPYPPAQIHYNDPEWNTPVRERHSREYYLPRFEYAALRYPFYIGPPLSIPNIAIFDTWGDFYNFLGPGQKHDPSPIEAANGRSLGATKLRIHSLLAHLGVIFFLVLVAGMIDAVRRLLAGQMRRVEIAAAILGAGYVFIMISYAIWHANEADGPVKACYALGASTILSLWTARPLAALDRRRFARLPITLLVSAPAAFAILQRLWW